MNNSMKQKKQIELINKAKNKIKFFNIGFDLKYADGCFYLFHGAYILNGIFYILALAYILTLIFYFIHIYLAVFFALFYLIFISFYGNKIAIWTHLVSGWTFAEPNLPEVQEFIKKYKLEKYVK
jgi:hypothetical protein